MTNSGREHSRKPDEFYALVESLCPGNKAEMFVREKREGCTALFSPELGKFSGESVNKVRFKEEQM